MYEIFDVTGFSQILAVTRKPEELSIEGLEKIGEGTIGGVYRVDDETVVKVANPIYDFDYVEAERAKGRAALVAGIPTAIPFKTVKVGDSYGALYELVSAESVSPAIVEDNAKAAPVGIKMGQLLRRLTTTQADTDIAQDTKRRYIDLAPNLAHLFGSDELAAAVGSAYEALPDATTYLHGDFHTGNMMFQGDELVLIDIGELGYGHPLLDLGSSCLMQKLTYVSSPTGIDQTGYPKAAADALWDAFIGECFDHPSPERAEFLDKLITAYGLCRMYLIDVMFYLRGLDRDDKAMKTALIPRVLPLIQAVPKLLSAWPASL